MYKKLKLRIFKVIDQGNEDMQANDVFDYFIVTLIVLNVAAIILQSFDDINAKYEVLFNRFEIFSAIVFTIEYILRIWTAELKYEVGSTFHARVKFILSPMAIIDLLAILPFYLLLLNMTHINIDLMFIRILRLTRLLRVFKLSRYSNALKLVAKVLKDKKEELMSTMFVTFILLLIASTLMYNIEHNAHKEAFPNIVASFWWAIATLTTIGYGDVYPVTGWGRLLSGIIAILGIGLVALPTGIISSSFIEELSTRHKKKEEKEEESPHYCPHCGKKLRD